jgi:uncharacterized protein (UPF0264 family)
MALIAAANAAGATGVLLDTERKEGPGLCRLVSPETVAAWVARAHGEGLTAALAGRLTTVDLPMVRETGADIVGVRGAVCGSGRSGPVVETRVQAVKSALLSSRQLTHR